MKEKGCEVSDELWKRRVHVCELQETKWTGESAWFVGARDRRYKFWWKGGDRTGGVGMLLKGRVSRESE